MRESTECGGTTVARITRHLDQLSSLDVQQKHVQFQVRRILLTEDQRESRSFRESIADERKKKRKEKGGFLGDILRRDPAGTSEAGTLFVHLVARTPARLASPRVGWDGMGCGGEKATLLLDLKAPFLPSVPPELRRTRR